jgi:hypothetical protein
MAKAKFVPMTNVQIQYELDSMASYVLNFITNDKSTEASLLTLIANTEGVKVSTVLEVMKADEDGEAYMDIRTMLMMKVLGRAVDQLFYPASAK